MKNLEERTKNTLEILGNNELKKCEKIQKIVNIILQSEGIVKTRSIPIVRIAEHYGIKPYTKKLSSKIASSISLDEKQKIIFVNSDLNLHWARYFIAVEFGEYLLHFLCDKDECSKTYYHQIYRDAKNTYLDIYKFAREILMPEHAFLKQYMIAAECDKRSIFIVKYLSEFFEVPTSIVVDRIEEIISSKH